MEPKTLKTESRSGMGTKRARRIRKVGRLPGIIYGHGKAPISFSIDRHDLEVELLHGQRLLTLKLEGKEESFLIKEVQYDHLGTTPIHIDLARVRLNETVTVHVSIALRGTPKGTGEGGVLDQMVTELEVECLASNIPDEIRASVSHLEVGDSLVVSDLELPEGVKIVAEPGKAIATIRVVAEEVAPEEVEEAEAAEPEVITKGKAEPEEADTEKA